MFLWIVKRMNINLKTVFISLLLLVQVGCASNFYNSKDDPRTINGFLDKSQTLITQQRWKEAELLLERAHNKFPDDVSINKALQSIKNEWKKIKRRLEDWIVVYEVESMLRQRPVLNGNLPNMGL